MHKSDQKHRKGLPNFLTTSNKIVGRKQISPIPKFNHKKRLPNFLTRSNRIVRSQKRFLPALKFNHKKRLPNFLTTPNKIVGSQKKFSPSRTFSTCRLQPRKDKNIGAPTEAWQSQLGATAQQGSTELFNAVKEDSWK